MVFERNVENNTQDKGKRVFKEHLEITRGIGNLEQRLFSLCRQQQLQVLGAHVVLVIVYHLHNAICPVAALSITRRALF